MGKVEELRCEKGKVRGRLKAEELGVRVNDGNKGGRVKGGIMGKRLGEGLTVGKGEWLSKRGETWGSCMWEKL